MKATQKQTKSNPLQIIIWNMDYQEIIRGGKRTTIKAFNYYICKNEAELIMIFKNIDAPIKEWTKNGDIKQDHMSLGISIDQLINKNMVVWSDYIKLKLYDMDQLEDYIKNLSFNGIHLDMEGASLKELGPGLWTKPQSTYYKDQYKSITETLKTYYKTKLEEELIPL